MTRMTLDELNAALALDGPPCWFGTKGPMRTELIGLVHDGIKTSTGGLMVEFAMEGEPVPVPGTRCAIIDNDETVVGVMVTIRQEAVRFADLTWEFARDEGEGFVDLEDCRTQLAAFWQRHTAPLVRERFDPDFVFDDDTLVSCEWFGFQAVDPPIPWPGRDEFGNPPSDAG
jgi:uncharacterized protein YhfF